MERLGPRWWPIFGSSYLLVGIKRVRGVRMLGAAMSSEDSAAVLADLPNFTTIAPQMQISEIV
jgi:hypothetical protein